MSPQADAVIARLERVRQRWWRCSLVSGLVLAGAFALAVFAAFALLDALLGPAPTRVARAVRRVVVADGRGRRRRAAAAAAMPAESFGNSPPGRDRDARAGKSPDQPRAVRLLVA